ncbi:MAG: serine protease, partial [Sphingobacteriales bacterium]
MIRKILSPFQIEQATVVLNCGRFSGTAFFVSNQQGRQLLITANHNLDPSLQIFIVASSGARYECSLELRIPEIDVSIIACNVSVFAEVQPLPLKVFEIPQNQRWESFGYPSIRIVSGGRFSGKVSRINHGTSWDVDLECDQYSQTGDFAGLSGAPLVVDGFVVGVMLHDNAGTLGATSISRFQEQLKDLKIEVSATSDSQIPDSLAEEIGQVTSNLSVLEKIRERLSVNGRSYFLISGSPGSGKTTIAAQISLNNEAFVLLDRFFVKIPGNDEYPTEIRATSDFVLQWIESVCHRVLFNQPPPKVHNETRASDRLLEIHNLLKALSTDCQRKGKVGVLIFDGLDEIDSSKIDDFLSFLPQNLPSNLKVVFSCISKESLPTRLQLTIDDEVEIPVTPLSVLQVESYLLQQLEEKQLTSLQIHELARKSEGHPLYLRYLIKAVLATDTSLVDNWIESIPKIGGEITNYYNKIWLQMKDRPDDVWLAATISRMRMGVEQDKLVESLPDQTKYSFLQNYNHIRHLLKETPLIRVYHSSFSDFVNERTFSLKEQVHTNIAKAALSDEQTVFGIAERVYHLAHGDLPSRQLAEVVCDQNWVDQCTLKSINPEIVQSDILTVIGLAAGHGRPHRLISLLLLSQRV